MIFFQKYFQSHDRKTKTKPNHACKGILNFLKSFGKATFLEGPFYANAIQTFWRKVTQGEEREQTPSIVAT